MFHSSILHEWNNFVTIVVGVIEAKIRSLRVEFSRRIRELNKPSGSAGSKKKPWRFMDSLMFLRDCVVPRSTTSNLNLSAQNMDEKDDEQVGIITFIANANHYYHMMGHLTVLLHTSLVMC